MNKLTNEVVKIMNQAKVPITPKDPVNMVRQSDIILIV